jgi:hypothetical protein
MAPTVSESTPVVLVTERVEHACVLVGYSGTGPAQVTVTHYDSAARRRRAVAVLARWWGVALVSVLIPVAHFVLVPLFFLYGIVTGVQRLTTVAVVTRAHGTCPDCGAEQELDIQGRWRVPRELACAQCRRGLRLIGPGAA